MDTDKPVWIRVKASVQLADFMGWKKITKSDISDIGHKS